MGELAWRVALARWPGSGRRRKQQHPAKMSEAVCELLFLKCLGESALTHSQGPWRWGALGQHRKPQG